MALSIAQAVVATANTAGNIAATITATQAGDQVVVCGYAANTATITTVTNDKGDTGSYQLANGASTPANDNGFAHGLAQWWFISLFTAPTVGSTVYTCHMTGAPGFNGMAAFNIRGATGALSLDKDILGNAVETSALGVSGLTGTLGHAVEVAIGMGTTGGGFTSIDTGQTGSGAFGSVGGDANGAWWSDQITSANGSIQAAYTDSSSSNTYECFLWTFFDSGGTATVIPHDFTPAFAARRLPTEAYQFRAYTELVTGGTPGTGNLLWFQPLSGVMIINVMMGDQ